MTWGDCSSERRSFARTCSFLKSFQTLTCRKRSRQGCGSALRATSRSRVSSAVRFLRHFLGPVIQGRHEGVGALEWAIRSANSVGSPLSTARPALAKTLE